MPGLSLINSNSIINESINDLKHERYIDIKRIIDTENLSLVFSGFKGYPYLEFRTKDFLIVLEGMIYNKSNSELEQSLVFIAKSFQRKDNYENNINEFVKNSCGAFIVFIYLINCNEFALFNDRWGRLQCFYYCDNKIIAISREIKFILHYMKKIEYDRIGMIEHLAVRYTLGDRTIFNKIKRILPGYLLFYVHNKFSVKEITPIKFNINPIVGFTKYDYVKKAKEILFSSTKDRLKKLKDFYRCIDLSGGYDSRAIFSSAYLCDNTVIPISIDLVTGDESSIANQIVNVYNTKLLKIKPKRDTSYSAIKDQLFKTDGLVDGRITSGCYPNRKYLNLKFNEPIASFMGFGGEFLRHPKVFKPFHKSMIDVIKIDSFPLLISNSIIKNVCRCLDFKESEIYSYWINYFNTYYKETNIADRIAHYYFDYYRTFVGQGEDRARIHVWTVNPMMSNDWLELSNNIIPREYCDYEFFENLLNEIDDKISVEQIPIWHIGFKRTNLYKFIISHKFTINLGKIYTKIKWKIKLTKDKQRKEMIKNIDSLYVNNKSIQNIFNSNGIEKIYKTEFGPNNWFIWQLFSLLLFMNSIEEKFPEKV